MEMTKGMAAQARAHGAAHEAGEALDAAGRIFKKTAQ
jgi:hypothetical protein